MRTENEKAMINEEFYIPCDGISVHIKLDLPDSDIIREYRRMKQFLAKSKLRYDESVINTVDSMISDSKLNHGNIKNLLRNLITE